MTCYHPIPAFRNESGVFFTELARTGGGVPLSLPCGQCIGCRLKRARDWSVRIMHEAQMHEENCFVTLTYGRDKLPPRGSLYYGDYQLFMRRLRRSVGKPVRFFMCGEYGEANFRPHYHACLFGIDFADKERAGKSASGHMFFSSESLERIWSHGRAVVQPLTRETAAYCARYIVGKVTGDGAKERYGELTPEFSHCSLRPGIGARWFERFGSDVYPHDYVVAGFQKHSPPRYYDKLLKRRDPKALALDDIEFARYNRARAASPDQTPERLEVREVVQKARVRFQKREL